MQNLSVSRIPIMQKMSVDKVVDSVNKSELVQTVTIGVIMDSRFT